MVVSIVKIVHVICVGVKWNGVHVARCIVVYVAVSMALVVVVENRGSSPYDDRGLVILRKVCEFKSHPRAKKSRKAFAKVSKCANLE
jgi:hypothetical protein